MNMKAAFLEVMNDALGSVAVVASALVMIPTGWNGFDAVAGAVIALMMIPRAIKLLHNAVKVLLEETPDGLDSIRYANIWKTCRMCLPCMTSTPARCPPACRF